MSLILLDPSAAITLSKRSGIQEMSSFSIESIAKADSLLLVTVFLRKVFTQLRVEKLLAMLTGVQIRILRAQRSEEIKPNNPILNMSQLL